MLYLCENVLGSTSLTIREPVKTIGIFTSIFYEESANENRKTPFRLLPRPQNV